MANTEATVQFRADVSNLKAGIQQAQRSIRLASSEFQKAASSMDDWSKSEEGLRKKLQQLDTTLKAQKKMVELAKQELIATTKAYGENSAEADRARMKLNNYEIQVNKTQKELDYYGKELDDCRNKTGKFADETDTATRSSSKATDGFTVMKGALADLVASGIKLAIDGLKNLASAAYEAYKEFDEGYDAVVKATGATGEAAKELEESYKNVAHNVVGDMNDIGTAVGEVSTRFGYQGKELEEASEQFLKYADITGTDVKSAVRGVSRALESSGADASEYTHLLDVLAKAGQSTGVDVNKLTETLTKLGAPMRQLGFSTEEQIALFAKFEKEGVNTEAVLAGLKRGVANWGKEGKNAKEEFSKVVDEIARTEDVAKASEIAIEAFGSKAGPELVEAIQSGKFEYQDFLKELERSEGVVTNTYEATQDGFDKIKLAVQGAKADVGSFVREVVSEHKDDIIKAIDKVKDAVKKAVKWVVNNADVILETLKSIGKVIAIVFTVKTLSKWASGINTVITAVKGFAAAMKGVEAASSMASSATGIFASLVSPGGAIVLGIAAVTAVTVALVNAFKEEKAQIDVLSEAQKESIQKSHELKAAYDEMDATRKANMQTVDNEFGYYRELLKEFDSIVGANGEVKKGYEDRAQFIMTTLNQALGMEMTMQDGIIQNYAKERQAINELLETKKAELILKANEEAYAEAIQKKTEATSTYLDAQKTFNDTMAAAEAQAVKVEETYMRLAQIEKEQGVEAAKEFQAANQDVFDVYQQMQVEVTNTRAALMEATEAYQGYNQTIENYEGLSSAIISGDAKKISDAMIKQEANFKSHANTTADVLKSQRDAFEENYKKLKEALDRGEQGITQQMVDDAKKLADQAHAEYLKSGMQTTAGYAEGLKKSSDYAEEAARNLGYDSYDEFNKAMGIESPSKKTKQSGEYFAQGFINGMDNKSSLVYQKAKALAQQAIQGLKDGQKEGSPSKITTQSGKYFTQGFINGIGSMSKELAKEVRGVVSNAISALGGSSIISGIKSQASSLAGGLSSPLGLGSINPLGGLGAGSNGVSGAVTTVNNFNLVQNNTSPKSLTALETFQARRRQVEMVKAMV